MPTTPTSMVNRLMGQEAFTDGILLASGETVGLAAPAVAVPAGTLTLTLTAALHGGRPIQIAPTGGLAITPPAATGTGVSFFFVCTAAITGGSFTFDAKAGAAADKIYGWLNTYKATTYTPYGGVGVVANANLITLNGTTTGGAGVGDFFVVRDMATNLWVVTAGFLIQSGSIATPFSNH